MKITDLTTKMYPKGPSTTVTLENGVKGYVDNANSDKDLKIGEDIIYTLTEGINQKTKAPYNLLVVKRAVTGAKLAPPPQSMPVSQVGMPRPVSQAGIVQLKAQAASDAMGFVKDFFVADKITYDKFKDYFVELKGYLFDAIDEAAG